MLKVFGDVSLFVSLQYRAKVRAKVYDTGFL